MTEYYINSIFQIIEFNSGFHSYGNYYEDSKNDPDGLWFDDELKARQALNIILIKEVLKIEDDIEERMNETNEFRQRVINDNSCFNLLNIKFNNIITLYENLSVIQKKLNQNFKFMMNIITKKKK